MKNKKEKIVKIPYSQDSTINWLLKGDISIRWQVMRDLLDRPKQEWQIVQSRLPDEGWCRQILKYRDASGRWTPRLYGKKWISTTYSLVLLRRMGLPPHYPVAVESCRLFLEEALWHDGGINISASLKRSETCVTGFVLALLSWFQVDDPNRERIVEYLLNEQMKDGGWNCMRHQGAVHSSFHTTINVLEGLHEYAVTGGKHTADTLKAEAIAREFFIQHRLYRSHRTGEVANPAFTRFSFPPRWYHDVLRTLDYFRSCKASYDERLTDPIGLLQKKQTKNGRWLLQNRHPGQTYFEMEKPGKESRWNTLRALRVLKWWNAAKQNDTHLNANRSGSHE